MSCANVALYNSPGKDNFLRLSLHFFHGRKLITSCNSSLLLLYHFFRSLVSSVAKDSQDYAKGGESCRYSSTPVYIFLSLCMSPLMFSQELMTDLAAMKCVNGVIFCENIFHLQLINYF